MFGCCRSALLLVVLITLAKVPESLALSSPALTAPNTPTQAAMVKPKKIINDPKDSVEEFIAGLLLQFPNRLVKLGKQNVILRAPSTMKNDKQRVHILSGGGSGHEPSHAGWIGEGMLTGAICGGIFASPSVAAIIAAVRAASQMRDPNSKDAVLLIIKNYTGDRLNFGMACEIAKAEGIPCQAVVIADDCALARSKGITGSRGVAGTVLVHKIAGAAAAAGMSLEEVSEIATTASRCMGTLGVALDAVTVPGADQVNDRLDGETIELGLGIHGEAGLKQSPLLSSDDMAKEMLKTILDFGRVKDPSSADSELVPMFSKGDNLCLLVNNLGGTSNFEMSILANSAVKQLENDYGCTVSRLMVGSFMTSFDMHGASITVLNLSALPSKIVDLLDSETDAAAWLKCDICKDDVRPSATVIPEIVVDETVKEQAKLPPVTIADFATTAKTLAQKAAQELSDQEPMLTKYDTIVGDGDAGITAKRGSQEILKRLEDGTISTEHPVKMFGDIAEAVSASMGGTSGVLFELMFRKMSVTLSDVESIGAKEMGDAFKAGVDAICLYGGASVGSRTMVDALIPASTGTTLAEAAAKAKEGADSTVKMTVAEAGRSNYLSAETLEGTPDPGAMAVAIVLGKLAEN